jgi:uncharacterized membrane protein YhaH (DUF805 family)
VNEDQTPEAVPQPSAPVDPVPVATSAQAAASAPAPSAPASGQHIQRIGRLGYLLMLVYLLVSMVALVAVTFVFATIGRTAPSVVPLTNIVIFLVALAWTILILYSSIRAQVRRLHDLNHSGWWILLAFVPIAGFVQGFFLLFAPGTPGANDFGEPSKSTGILEVMSLKGETV